MATIDHGGMGNSDDFDGHRARLQGFVDRAPLPGGCGSRSIPGSGLLYYHVVLPSGSTIPASHVLQCCQCRWSLFRNSGIWNRCQYSRLQ